MTAPLAPSLLEQPTYRTRRRRTLLDAGSLLTLTVALAMLVPAHLVLPKLSGIGRPAIAVGLVLTIGWFVSKLHPGLVVPGRQPLRWAAGIYLTALLLAYAAGHLRGLPRLEANAADMAMILYLVFLGIALVCADGLPHRSRLDDVLRALVLLGATMALIGHLQYAFDLNLAAMIRLPGLVDHRDVVGFRDRGDGFFQVASTAAHYIEFSTIMAMLLPFAIHLARFGGTGRLRWAAGIGGVMMAAAIPVTLSRTGFVGLAVAMIVLALYWDWRTRLNVAVIAVAVTAALMVVRPGLLGTLRSLFVYAGDDPSVHGRTEDYPVVAAYVAERPWLGRGPGTFIPSLYRFIDNDWLIHLVTVGVIGTAAYAAWHLTALTLAVIAYRRARRPEDRHLCACLIAVQVTAVTVAAMFDVMAFTTHTTVLAVLTGAAGAMWRFTHPCRRVRDASAHLTDAPRPR